MAEFGPVNRRAVLGLIIGAPFIVAPAARAAAVLEDDGHYVQDWYLKSFLDLAEDAQAAHEKGKAFAVQWGMRGCPACKQLHTGYFSKPEIERFVREKFDVTHLDIFGSREVVDVDGERLGEKALATKRAVRTTPAFQFFSLRDGAVVEVARMPGLLAESEFLAMFRYVDARGYADESFKDWLKAREAG